MSGSAGLFVGIATRGQCGIQPGHEAVRGIGAFHLRPLSIDVRFHCRHQRSFGTVVQKTGLVPLEIDGNYPFTIKKGDDPYFPDSGFTVEPNKSWLAPRFQCRAEVCRLRG